VILSRGGNILLVDARVCLFFVLFEIPTNVLDSSAGMQFFAISNQLISIDQKPQPKISLCLD
jgi:hypothetical protein